MMTANNRQRNEPASLTVQVMQAELRVLQRRRLVAVRASMLGLCIRRQLTSPAMLLFAGGLGFAAGKFTRHQAPAPGNTERSRRSHNKLLGRTLKLVAFARMLSKAVSSAPMARSVPTGQSSQVPVPQFRSAAS